MMISLFMVLLITILGSFSFFSKSNAIVIFIIFLAFSLAIFSICFFLSSLFSRSKTALIVTIISYWLTYFVSELLDTNGILPMYKYLASIFPTIAITLISSNLGAFEGSSTGI